MENTKRYIKSLWKIFSWAAVLVGTIYAAFISAGYTAMIDYYCTGSLYAACPVYVSLAQIFVVSLAICLLFLVTVVAFDFSADSVVKIGNSHVAQNIVNVNHQRDAKITIVPVFLKGEVFVAIRNDEFFYLAEDVVVNSKFYNHDNKKVDKNIKWFDKNARNDKTSIKPKKHSILHLATISEDKLIIHFYNGDEVFPFPNTVNNYYAIPLYVTGSMSFIGKKINKILFPPMNEILVYNNKEIKIRW
jgi:hypothetical protein